MYRYINRNRSYYLGQMAKAPVDLYARKDPTCLCSWYCNNALAIKWLERRSFLQLIKPVII